jgi:alcohol dehydrogenase
LRAVAIDAHGGLEQVRLRTDWPEPTAGFDPKTDIRYIWRREVSIIGANGWTREDLETLLLEVERGTIKPIIDHVLPLADSAEAMRILQDRKVFGKVIVTP